MSTKIEKQHFQQLFAEIRSNVLNKPDFEKATTITTLAKTLN